MYVIIPARYASTRLPGKPLLDVAGKPLLQRVYECAQASGAAQVIVATDDARIAAAVKGFGGQVCMTGAAHASGTDRLAEVVATLKLPEDTTVVNLQGDEPLMPPSLIAQVAATLDAHPDCAMATACHPFTDPALLTDPNVVKVVCDQAGRALYFSRAPIPWPRDRGVSDAPLAPAARRHIGIYAYRAGFLARFSAWPASDLEQVEMLEQLRALWYGERIAVCEAREAPGAGVDTPADLERVRAWFGRDV